MSVIHLLHSAKPLNSVVYRLLAVALYVRLAPLSQEAGYGYGLASRVFQVVNDYLKVCRQGFSDAHGRGRGLFIFWHAERCNRHSVTPQWKEPRRSQL